MPTDKHTESDYNALNYKYNRLLSAYNALRQEHAEGEQVWKGIEKDLKDEIAAMRRFLERILAKSPEEIGASFGQECSWGALSTRELLNKAAAAYDQYNLKRTELLRKLQAISEERSQTIENLITQNAVLREELQQAPSRRSEGESTAQPERSGKPVPAQTMNRVSLPLQKAVDEGGVAIEIEEEEEDISREDIEQLAEVGAIGAVRTAIDNGLKISSAQIATQKIQDKVREKTGRILYDAEDVRKRMCDRHWCTLMYIGNTGNDAVKDIAVAVIEACAKGEIKYAGQDDSGLPNFGLSTIRTSIKELCSMQLLIEETIPLPNGRKQVCRLSDLGVVFYKEGSSGKTPVQSQCEKIAIEHDNLEHGYGILELAKLLEEHGDYASVSTNRTENTIKRNDFVYIPDVVAVSKKRTRRGAPIKHYFEYERNTHHTTDFHIKLNKMAMVTSRLYFVTPNQDAVEGIKKKVDSWIKSRGSGISSMDHTVYITSYKKLASASNIDAEEAWFYIIPVSKAASQPNKPEKAPAAQPAKPPKQMAPVTLKPTSGIEFQVDDEDDIV